LFLATKVVPPRPPGVSLPPASAPPSGVDDAGIVGAKTHDLAIASDRHNFLAANREGLRFGPTALQRRHLGIVHDQVGGCFRLWRWRLGPDQGAEPAIAINALLPVAKALRLDFDTISPRWLLGMPQPMC
jgi:hypothetical protein